MDGIQSKDVPDHNSRKAKVLTPTFGIPAIEECFQRDLGLRIETIIAEKAVVGRQRADDLRWASDEVASGLLGLDST